MFVERLLNNRDNLRLTLRLRTELAREFGFFAVRGVRLVKIEDRSVVLQGWLRKERVIFKKYLAPTAADIVTQAADELRFLEANLPRPFFVNRCIAAAPGIGVIVLGWVPGRTVRHVLTVASASRRNEVLQLAGGWLACCADLRSQDRPLRPQWYLTQLHSLCTQHLTSEDRDLIGRMLDELLRLAGRLQGVQTPHAIAHNDLTLVNLYYCAGTIHAIDINGTLWTPVMRMAARFLIMKDLFNPPLSPDLFHGLDADDALLFLNAAGISVAQKRAVRFFIGEQMVQIYLIRQAKSDKCTLARDRMAAFLTPPAAGDIRDAAP